MQGCNFRKLILLVISTLLSISGCVAVQNNLSELDSGNIPPDHAVLFIAVDFDWLDGDEESLELNIGNSLRIFLQENAINRIYIPAGDWQLLLQRVPQDKNNRRTYFTFKPGSQTKLKLIWRETETGNEENSSSVLKEYSLLPTKNIAFDKLLKEEKLPVIDITFEE